MDKEIDVKLFVTCRLCIEEVGQYQIVPVVQEQFKYCFDINVEPFDGLPQLICQKCKDILNQFYKLKKLYCEKQTDLTNKYKKGIPVECTPQHDFVTSSSTMTCSTERPENVETKNTKKKNRCHFSSESNDSIKHKNKKIRTAVKKPIIKWDYTGYKKEFVCIVCNSAWASKVSLRKHQTSHNKLLSQHPTMFKNNLSVILEKIDGKPNVTGMTNIVVHNSNTIIEYYNALCYIKYSKYINKISHGKDSKNVRNEMSSNDIFPENSDIDEEKIGIPKHRKRRRVLSRSSTDTVVLESNRGISDNEESKQETELCTDVQQSQDDQCINIVDSSDSDVDRHQIDSTHRAKQPVEANDHKIIQEIISTCVKAYKRKPESTENSNINIESQLKHKVLSLGRKIINNRQSFNWTGLLKYLAHRNLSVTWSTKAISSNNGKDSDYVRIMTKLRDGETSGDSHVWTPVAPPNEVLVVESDQASVSNQIKKSISENINSVQPDADSAVLVICNQTDHKSKLLNANPVANPKQLPRKSTQNNEARFNPPTIEPVAAPFTNNEDPDLCMPIITSTTSLAAPNIIEDQNGNSSLVPTITPVKQTDPPRIKVKPYSQLMSENALNNLRHEFSSGALPMNMLQNQTDNSMNMLQNNIQHSGTMSLTPIQNNNDMQWPSQDLSNTILPNTSPQVAVAQPMQMVSFVPATSYNPVSTTPNNSTRNREEYGILNSIDLPNTKTNSPFEYLENLFMMHNLVLIAPQNSSFRHFVTLIKFKLKFQQERILDPLVLCLSLYCFKNTFCFTVKDRYDINLNIRELSANWQWEIIKGFNEQVVEKVLQNAQKHSQETLEFTKKFIYVLKSVSYKKLP